MTQRSKPRDLRRGFTLVEMMVVILIIGLLMTISVTAVTRALTSGRQTAIRLEINALSQAVEQYMQKYGDYPPDGSSWAVLDRHMRRLFPRMSAHDKALLDQLTQDRNSGNFSAVAMDRAEALVFFLGGFSENPLHPLTGEGGPLSLRPGVGSPSTPTDLEDYQYNATRDNAFFDFDLARLTLRRSSDTGPLLSTDEEAWGTGTPQYSQAGRQDPLPVYLARSGDEAPLVYFDSRTYGVIGKAGSNDVYNGYARPGHGGLRPYKSELAIEAPKDGSAYADVLEAFSAVPFHNPKTFQIISPGLDAAYGSLVGGDTEPVHFVTESGRAVRAVSGPPAGIFVAGVSRFQDGDSGAALGINGHLDNVTNFSTSTLENDLQ